MELKLDRKYKLSTYTIGILYVNGERFCETLEDKDRGLKKTDFLFKIKRKKVYGETAIPTGTYEIRMDIVSPKYKEKKWYNDFCGGKMPRLMNVPGWDGILVHPGNTNLDTYGCLLVGKNTKKGCVLESRDTFVKLYNKMKVAADAGEKINITIY
jgi:hypothetical protein